MPRAPSIPSLLQRKVYKTGQTRGADDDQIYQNRVGRNSTCLIPFSIWQTVDFVRRVPYEKGFIVLVRPDDYFGELGENLVPFELTLGENCLLFYEERSTWEQYEPENYGYAEPNSRTSPLGGEYVARIANTTASNMQRINVGYTYTDLKGAGIRQYEYASSETIKECRIQSSQPACCKSSLDTNISGRRNVISM